jgi:hypothetical protein
MPTASVEVAASPATRITSPASVEIVARPAFGDEIDRGFLERAGGHKGARMALERGDDLSRPGLCARQSGRKHYTLDERFMGSSGGRPRGARVGLAPGRDLGGRGRARLRGTRGPTRRARRRRRPRRAVRAPRRALEVECVDAASKARDGAPARGRPRPYRLRHARTTRRTAELPACERILKLTGPLPTRSGRVGRTGRAGRAAARRPARLEKHRVSARLLAARAWPELERGRSSSSPCHSAPPSSTCLTYPRYRHSRGDRLGSSAWC